MKRGGGVFFFSHALENTIYEERVVGKNIPTLMMKIGKLTKTSMHALMMKRGWWAKTSQSHYVLFISMHNLLILIH